jgi:hypothetical protein
MIGDAPTKRPISDLLAVDDPAWPHLRDLLERATVPVTVLPVEPQAGADVLYRLQVTARSWLGAFALHTGAVLVDHGWLRMLGGGTTDLPDLASTGEPGFLVIALDVLGGRFAINGGALPGSSNEICYFAPDTLRWRPLGCAHAAFISSALGGGLDGFYENCAGRVGRTKSLHSVRDRDSPYIRCCGALRAAPTWRRTHAKWCR